MTRGDLVWIWFDTGAFGARILYGRVIEAGPKAYRVMWESTLTNRFRQDDTSVKRVECDACKAGRVHLDGCCSTENAHEAMTRADSERRVSRTATGVK
jgi:hypothetical protein